MISAMHSSQDTHSDLCLLIKLLRIKDHLAVDDCRHDYTKKNRQTNSCKKQMCKYSGSIITASL